MSDAEPLEPPVPVDTEPGEAALEVARDPRCECGYPLWEDVADGRDTCSWCKRTLFERVGL